MENVKFGSEETLRERIETPEACKGYEVLDAVGISVGKAAGIFVNDFDEIEYIKIKPGILRKEILIPVEMVSVDDEKKTLALR